MDKNLVTIMLDNGHGKNTNGKNSPKFEDGTQLFEYEFNRDIVRRVQKILESEGYITYLICPEEIDISLITRVRRANYRYNMDLKQNKKSILVSIHANADKNPGWSTSRGWSAFTSKGQTAGDKLADKLYEAAHIILDPLNLRIREQKYNDGDPDYEENYYILYNTNCPACLVENFFMNNKKDCKFLMSEEGRKAITDLIVLGIKKYIESI